MRVIDLTIFLTNLERKVVFVCGYSGGGLECGRGDGGGRGEGTHWQTQGNTIHYAITVCTCLWAYSFTECAVVIKNLSSHFQMVLCLS